VSPIPAGDARGSYFDQIDDDFPYEGSAPNTRTFWRPGARAALAACGIFATQHVFTAAQDTYTANIMRELDGSAFATVTTRDGVPSCVKRGKDLSLVVDRSDRSLLFDDRAKNFRPQRGRNGVLVKPYDRAATSDARFGTTTAPSVVALPPASNSRCTPSVRSGAVIVRRGRLRWGRRNSSWSRAAISRAFSFSRSTSASS